MIKLKSLIKEMKLRSTSHKDWGIGYAMERLEKLDDIFHGIDYDNGWKDLHVSPKAKQLTTKIQKMKKDMISLVKTLDKEIMKVKK